jgi:alpha-ketoglutaric semialdehyde dehydrogenase
MTTLQGKSLLAGQTGATGGAVFQAINPSTGEKFAPDFHEASLAEVDAALNAAAAAFEIYRLQSPETRAKLLDAIAAEIEALGDTLLQRAHAESGLPLARLTGERARTCGQLRLFAAVVREGSWVDARIDPALPDRQPLPRPDLRRMLIALGPVVVFGSSNFPFAFSVAGGDTASAFAAGCSIVVKAHRAHPGTSELVGQAIVRAVKAVGLPAGLFSLVHDSGYSIGVAMVKHPAVAAVGFTGSHTAGRALWAAAAARPNPIPVFAEMSSLNPVFILPEALRERGAAIATGLVGSFTLGVGQFCTKPGLIFVVRGAATDAFLQTLATTVQGAAPATMLTPGIKSAFDANRAKVTQLPSVNVLAASTTAPDATKTQGQPSIAVTTAANFLKRPELATEAFGPFALVITGESADELLACARALEGQLTATLHGTTSDLTNAAALISVLEQKAGRLLLNGFPTGVEVSPAMNHGGPSPATSDARFTSVGTAAILRFARPICYQNFPPALLPAALQDANPLGVMRLFNGAYGRT